MAEFQQLHHVAIVARKMASAKRFYQDLLGLRLTRKTVNPDDPYTPLWVFGARPGLKGSRLQVFFYPRSTRAVLGFGMVESLALRIPPRSSEYWRRRLRKHHLEGEVFEDADGCRLRLVECALESDWPYDEDSDVPEEFAVRGIGSVSLLVSKEGKRFWQERGSPVVQLVETGVEGRRGFGTVHHVAFQTFRKALEHDRGDSRSSYFYSPDGLLCECITEEQGPTFEEAPGKELWLPPWYEERREEIESVIRSMK